MLPRYHKMEYSQELVSAKPSYLTEGKNPGIVLGKIFFLMKLTSRPNYFCLTFS